MEDRKSLEASVRNLKEKRQHKLEATQALKQSRQPAWEADGIARQRKMASLPTRRLRDMDRIQVFKQKLEALEADRQQFEKSFLFTLQRYIHEEEAAAQRLRDLHSSVDSIDDEILELSDPLVRAW